MNLAFAGKSIVIALVAAGVAWVYLLAFARFNGSENTVPAYPAMALYGSMLGSFMIGLPVSVLVFWMSHKHLVKSPTTLAMIAVIAGIMMILASFVVGDREAVLVMGVPAFLAAITFGVCGWFWILKPMREAPRG